MNEQYNENGKRICGAKKRNGQPCQARPMANGRCRLHGGKSLGGLNAPALKHGRHSKYLPKDLLGKYKTALADPDLLQLHDEIALIDARLAQVLGVIEAGAETAQTWEEIQSEYASLMEALQCIPAFSEQLTGEGENENFVNLATQWRKPKRGKPAKQEKEKAGEILLASLANLGNLITAGADNRAAWEDVQSLVEQRRKLVESERKWYLENQQMITAEKALLLIAAIADVIRQNVTNTQEKQKIIQAITQLSVIESS